MTTSIILHSALQHILHSTHKAPISYLDTDLCYPGTIIAHTAPQSTSLLNLRRISVSDITNGLWRHRNRLGRSPMIGQWLSCWSRRLLRSLDGRYCRWVEIAFMTDPGLRLVLDWCWSGCIEAEMWSWELGCRAELGDSGWGYVHYPEEPVFNDGYWD